MKCIVIDEISMLSGELFDRLDYVLRELRGKPNEPFGGLQVVLCGGPTEQLPPIPGRIDSKVSARLVEGAPEWYAFQKQKGSCEELFLNRGEVFQSTAFWSLGLRFHDLKAQHRQSKEETLGDGVTRYVDILNRVREGRCTAQDIEMLNKHCYENGDRDPAESHSGYLMLCSTNAKADLINANARQTCSVKKSMAFFVKRVVQN